MTIGDDLRDILGAEDGETLVAAARRVVAERDAMAASRATYAAQRVSAHLVQRTLDGLVFRHN